MERERRTSSSIASFATTLEPRNLATTMLGILLSRAPNHEVRVPDHLVADFIPGDWLVRTHVDYARQEFVMRLEPTPAHIDRLVRDVTRRAVEAIAKKINEDIMRSPPAVTVKVTRDYPQQ